MTDDVIMELVDKASEAAIKKHGGIDGYFKYLQRLDRARQKVHPRARGEARRPRIMPSPISVTGQTNASPMRYLTGIRTTAYSNTGAATVLPPATFKYGSDARPWDQTSPARTPLPQGIGDDPDGILLDMNGDGIPDWVQTRISSNGQGELVWYDGSNLSSGGVMRLPTIPWRNGLAPSGREKLTLSGQYTDTRNTQPQFPNTRLGSRRLWLGSGRPLLWNHRLLRRNRRLLIGTAVVTATGVEPLFLRLSRRRSVVLRTSLCGPLLAMLLATAERATQIRTTRITGMGEKPNRAMHAASHT
jgi:hypothetical protein